MKKVKISTIILLIILVTMVAFFGIYVNVQNRMENKVEDYSYAMDLSGARIVRLKVDTSTNTIIKDADGKEVEDASSLTDEELTEKGYVKEEVPVNKSEDLKLENYEKAKKIIEKRLQKANVSNYIIKLDNNSGDIIVELTEDDGTDAIVSMLESSGSFEISDTNSKEVLLNNDDIKSVKAVYGASQTGNGTSVYLDFEFTKEGAKKLGQVSNDYKTVEDNTTEENTVSDNETENTEQEEKTITMKIDGEEIMTQSFEEPIENGRMQLSIGTATTDQQTFQENISQASTIATVLDSGRMPVEYTVDENQYIHSDITENQIQIGIYVVLALALIALVVMIIRYKMLGLLGAISYVGLVSIFLLIIRYANVVLSMEGILGIVVIMILNYIFVNKFLSKLKEKNKELNKTDVQIANNETYKEFFIKIVPICITVITFCFINFVPISSFGMTMFWGIALIAGYNVVITNNLFKLKADK